MRPPWPKPHCCPQAAARRCRWQTASSPCLGRGPHLCVRNGINAVGRAARYGAESVVCGGRLPTLGSVGRVHECAVGQSIKVAVEVCHAAYIKARGADVGRAAVKVGGHDRRLHHLHLAVGALAKHIERVACSERAALDKRGHIAQRISCHLLPCRRVGLLAVHANVEGVGALAFTISVVHRHLALYAEVGAVGIGVERILARVEALDGQCARAANAARAGKHQFVGACAGRQRVLVEYAVVHLVDGQVVGSPRHRVGVGSVAAGCIDSMHLAFESTHCGRGYEAVACRVALGHFARRVASRGQCESGCQGEYEAEYAVLLHIL